MTVIDWDKSDMLNYLGTYFPRSFTEAYCLFSDFLNIFKERYRQMSELSLLDFGSGTGGEIIGLLLALNEHFPNIKTVRITPIDGNDHALRLFDKVIKETQKHVNVELISKTSPVFIEDFYDLSTLNHVLKDKYDIILSFKAICEFVTKQQFENRNAYEHIVDFLMPNLTDSGLLLLVDVTSFNGVSKEWLPKMLDKGLMNVKSCTIRKNEGYSQTFQVSHSQRVNDCSKIAWRLIVNSIQIH